MYRTTIEIKAEKKFIDITDQINHWIRECNVDGGLITIHTLHTTCGLKIMENELLSLSDIDDFLQKLAPSDQKYAHDKIDLREVPLNERINGVSHVRMLFFNSSIVIPIVAGGMILGEWQRLFFVEMDGLPPRTRTIIVTITE